MVLFEKLRYRPHEHPFRPGNSLRQRLPTFGDLTRDPVDEILDQLGGVLSSVHFWAGEKLVSGYINSDSKSWSFASEY